MFALLFDTIAAFFIAKKVERTWVQIVLAIAAGIASSITANMLMYLIFPGTFTPGETMIRMVSGFIWHPLITLIELWFLRKKLKLKGLARTP